MAAPGRSVLTWGFFDEIADWARWVALAVIVVGTVVTRDWRFALSCGIGAAVDIRLMRALVARSKADTVGGTSAGVVGVFSLRILVKALLLIAAFFLPQWLDLWGMFLGILAVEITLMTVGAAVAAARVMRSHGDEALRG